MGQPLAKATLVALTAAAVPDELGTPVPVQFNPTSMRLVMSNSVSGATAPNRQVQQYTGSSSTTLTLDLVFDTADEGTTAEARSVRERTLEVARFVLPSGEGESKQAPPRVRFHWGTFVFDGVMTSYSEDIDLFSAEGVALRAKVSVTIEEQDSSFESLKRGAGANEDAGAIVPGQISIGPGLSFGGSTNRTGIAFEGEASVDFAVRMGLEPAAWRSFSEDIADPLSLPAGLSIDFNDSVTTTPGIGARGGAQAGGRAPVEAQVGLAGGAAGQRAGFALAAAGGLRAALDAVTTDRTSRAAAASRDAFQPATSASGGAGDTRGATPALAAPTPAVPDDRSATFGFAVPLRPRVTGPESNRPDGKGRVVVGVRSRRVAAPETRQPGVPPWTVLPAAVPERRASAGTGKDGHRGCGCGPCTGGHR